MSFGVPLPESESEFPSYPHFPQVYQIAWKPAAPGVFPDRPASAGSGQAAAVANGGGAPAAPSAYVPPHLRGKAGAAAPARPAFSLHDYEAAKKVGGGSVLGKALPPGAEEEDEKLSKGALKKKKAKEKAVREKEAADALEVTNFFFFFTLVTGPRRPLSLKLRDTCCGLPRRARI